MGVLRSLGEGGLASVGSIEVTKGTTVVKPWGSTNRSGVLYGQKSVNPALVRIGLNIVGCPSKESVMVGDTSDAEDLDPELVRNWFDTLLEYHCVCQYCGFDGSRTPEDWVQLQGDHLIPRHIAGEHAEDSLNRVTACYYCNSLKRRYDPTKGRFTQIPSREVQQELIQEARNEIERRKTNVWRYGGGLEDSYKFMMRRLRP